jgi:hypothetical protein
MTNDHTEALAGIVVGDTSIGVAQIVALAQGRAKVSLAPALAAEPRVWPSGSPRASGSTGSRPDSASRV